MPNRRLGAVSRWLARKSSLIRVARQARLCLGQRYRCLQRPADLAQAHAAPGRDPVKRLRHETPRRLAQAGGEPPRKLIQMGAHLGRRLPYRVLGPPLLGVGLLSVCTGILPRAEGPSRHKEPPKKYAGQLRRPRRKTIPSGTG